MITTEDFKEDILLDIKWREKEFIKIKDELSTYQSKNDYFNEKILDKTYSNKDREDKERHDSEELFFCRLSLPLIYAHWEGFFKYSIRSYLKYISDSEVNLSELVCEMVAYKLEAFMRKLQAKASFSHKKEFINEYESKISSIAKFTKGELRVDTRSNLNFDVISDLCEQFVLKVEYFEKYKTIIDRLVNQRNSICHGENSNLVNSNQVMEYIDVVMELFGVILIQLSDKVSNKDFIKKEVLA